MGRRVLLIFSFPTRAHVPASAAPAPASGSEPGVLEAQRAGHLALWRYAGPLLRLAVDRHNDGAAEPKVVLQRDFGIGHLSARVCLYRVGIWRMKGDASACL